MPSKSTQSPIDPEITRAFLEGPRGAAGAGPRGSSQREERHGEIRNHRIRSAIPWRGRNWPVGLKLVFLFLSPCISLHLVRYFHLPTPPIQSLDHAIMSRHAKFNESDVVTEEKPSHLHIPDGAALSAQESATTGGMDVEKSSSRYANSETGIAFKAENATATRKLLFKLGESSIGGNVWGAVLTHERRCGHLALCRPAVPRRLPRSW